MTTEQKSTLTQKIWIGIQYIFLTNIGRIILGFISVFITAYFFYGKENDNWFWPFIISLAYLVGYFLTFIVYGFIGMIKDMKDE